MTLILLSVYPVLLGVAVLMGRAPLSAIGFCAVLSIIAFIAYGLDKMAATNGAPRLRETSMLFIGLIGGWPGALAGQRLFHHKTKKTSFQIAFWLTVVINLLVSTLLLVGFDFGWVAGRLR